jgi:hypothetical protein
VGFVGLKSAFYIVVSPSSAVAQGRFAKSESGGSVSHLQSNFFGRVVRSRILFVSEARLKLRLEVGMKRPPQPYRYYLRGHIMKL